jgi:propionyl-CoA carboxylase beta chain
MIRHGAELVHAYAEATVPRLCVLLRKAYGGAYIVMDSKNLGNDWCVAWPTAEVAVMGAPGAVQILYRRDLAAIADDAERLAEQLALEAEYAERFANPYVAAERAYVDDVIAAADTRRVLADALLRLGSKRERTVGRRHSNTPL